MDLLSAYRHTSHCMTEVRAKKFPYQVTESCLNLFVMCKKGALLLAKPNGKIIRFLFVLCVYFIVVYSVWL